MCLYVCLFLISFYYFSHHNSSTSTSHWVHTTYLWCNGERKSNCWSCSNWWKSHWACHNKVDKVDKVVSSLRVKYWACIQNLISLVLEWFFFVLLSFTNKKPVGRFLQHLLLLFVQISLGFIVTYNTCIQACIKYFVI